MSHVLVPLAQGCEELEAITITDLLVRTGKSITRHHHYPGYQH